MTEDKEKVTVTINSKLWRKAKKLCFDKDMRYSHYIELLIEASFAKLEGKAAASAEILKAIEAAAVVKR